MNVTLQPHEVDALRNLLICARAFAKILNDPQDQYVQKLNAWTAMIELVMARGDLASEPNKDQAAALREGRRSGVRS